MGATVVDGVVSQALGGMAPPAAPVAPPPSKSEVIDRITQRAPAPPAPNVVAPDAPTTPTVDLSGQPRVIDPNNPPVIFGQPTVDDPLGINGAVTPAPAETPVVDAIAANADGAAPAVPAVPVADQKTLESGTDVGTGDSLFRVRGADGLFKSAPSSPDDVIEIAFRDENGNIKEYKKDLKGMARMARDGIAGQKVLDEVKFFREREPQVQATFQKVQQQLDAQLALNRAMLENEDEYINRVLEYRDATSPEKRLAALEADLQAKESARLRAETTQQFTRDVQDFHSTRIAPVVDAAIKELPLEMVLGKIALDTDFMKGPDGKIPKAAWSKYSAYINGAFRQWAATQVATRRTQTADQARAVAASRSASVQDLTAVGRAMAPPRGGGLPGDATRPLPPARTKDEAMQRIINRPISSL